MTLRRLTEDDAPALRTLWAEGLRTRPDAFLLTEAELMAIPADRFAAGIPAAFFFGTFDQGQLIGFVCARQGGVERLRHTADIGPLYVTEAATGQGHGKALMQAALDALTKKGLLQVELTVDASNTAARALYHNLGFEAFGQRPRSVLVGGVARTDLLMIRTLDGADLTTPA